MKGIYRVFGNIFVMNILDGEKDKNYIVEDISGNDEIRNFLFSLGCFEGESIRIIKKMKTNTIVKIKDGRYAIDKELAKIISIKEGRQL